MALKDHLRTLRIAAWLGWEVESNWTRPWIFMVYSLIKPIAAVLTLVFMYLVILRDVTGNLPFFSFMYVGNAFYLFLAQVLFGLTWVLHEDREHFQTLGSIYIAPVSFYVYVLGRAVSKILITAVAVFITLVFGVLALGLPVDPLGMDWPMFLAATVIGLICVATLGVALAGVSMLTAKHSAGINEAVAGIFYLFCGVIFPLSTLPGPVQGLGLLIPFTYWLEVIRRALLPSVNITAVSGLDAFSNLEIMVLLVLSSVFFTLLSYGIFRYADYRARKKGKVEMITTY